jgi:hypothetical protein
MNEEPTQQQPPQPETNWQFNADNSPHAAETVQPAQSNGPVRWTASEFIQHDKTAIWYLGLIAGAAILAALIFLLTKDKISTAIIIVVAIVFGIFAGRRPRELEYQVDDSGIHIGQKSYTYADFKSFAIVEEEALESIWLMPLKRFMPIITIYFAPNDGQKIVDTLSSYLPVAEHKLDSVDKLMHRLRF